LLLESLTKLSGGGLREVVDTRSNRALVGEESRDATLVLGTGTANERRVVQQTILGGVTLGLQSTEKSLLSTENLDGGGRVLGQVGQATSVRDQTSTDDLTNQRSQVGGDNAHLGDQVLVKLLAVLSKADNTLGKGNDVLHVGFTDLLAHTVLGGIDDALGNILVILHESGNVVQVIIIQVLLVLDEECDLGVTLVVRDNLVQFGEVPRVPLTNTHGEGVNGLVKLVKDGDGLNDVVVVTLDGELDLSAGVGVTQTKLGGIHVALAELVQQLGEVQTDATEKILDNLAGVTGFTLHEGEGGLDATGETLVAKAESDLALLVGLGEVQFEERDQSL
jgi:hypothetical protein